MSEPANSKYFSAMPEADRLHYNNKTGTSNLIDWHKKMVLFMEALYGSKCSSVFRDKALPKYMIGPYVADKDLPTGNDAVAVEARKLDYGQWFKNREEFVADLPKVISVLQTGTMTESSLQRIQDTRETEMDTAIKNQDILEVLDIVWTSHQYRGRAYRVSDQRRVQKEFAVFDYQDGESFVGLKRRFNELMEKMKNFSVIETDFNKMYQFLLAAAKYPNPRISEQAMKYLGLADDNSKFPKSVNTVYDELISLEEVEAQIRSDSKRSHRDAGSVHMITGDKSKAQKSNPPLQVSKQVLTAHSAVNKALKKRFETKSQQSSVRTNSNNNYPRNAATEAWAEQEMLKTGKSHSEVLDTLQPCHKCGKRRHLSKDCRAGSSNNNSYRNSNGSSNKSSFNRKPQGKPVKRSGVHAAKGSRSDGDASDPEMSTWNAHVYMIKQSGSDSDMPELISNTDTDSSEAESLDISYRKYNKESNLMLYNTITRPFSGHIAGYRQVEGSTGLDITSAEEADCLDSARKYGAVIPYPVEDSYSFSSVYAVYQSTSDSIDKEFQSHDPMVISNNHSHSTQESAVTGHASEVLYSRKRSVKFDELTSMKEPSYFRSCSPPPDISEVYKYTVNDLDPPSDFEESELSDGSNLDTEVRAEQSKVFVARTVEKVSPESQPSPDSNERASPINWDFPFPDEEHLCLMISARVMVRFVDSDTLTSWILARESHIPEIRNRWRMAAAFLNNGLERLEDNEIGIVYDYARGSSPRATGVFLPDEDAEGFHLGPNGEFLERVRINGWLIAYGVSDFVFNLPNMQQTWNELQCVYGRIFSSHPFFNNDQSWNMYQDLLQNIQQYESRLSGSEVRHIWPFYNPITRSYTYNPEEWGSPTKIRPTWNNRADQSSYFTPIERPTEELQSPPIAGVFVPPMNMQRELTEEEVTLRAEEKPPDPERYPFGTEHVEGGLLFDINYLLEKLEKDGLLNSSSSSDSEVDGSKVAEDKSSNSGGVHMARHYLPQSKEPYNNHTFYCLDSMANVSVFRNPELLTDIRSSDKPLSIDGVGAKLTKVDQVGTHHLFGEVWYLPTNEYNIVSQWQAQKNGFLLKMSEDNKSCYLYRGSDRTAMRFVRDPIDHFYKCPATDREIARVGKAFEINAHELHEAYSVNNHSMYYSQEQLRRADIVESLHVSLEHPSDSQLVAFIQSPSSINLPVSVQDVHNLRAIKGPCPICLEGRPKPHKGSHSSYNVESEPTKPGELLHVDIVFVQKKPRLFAVDHVTGYMSFILLDTKHQEDLVEAFVQIINAYKSYLKVVRGISCDHESVLRSCETELNRHGVKMSYRIPGEHEKIAERSMRVVRERMRVKRRELPYSLPKRLYDELAAECIRNINLMPNSKSMPFSPSELVRGEKINFLTDITPPFGSLVLCPVADNDAGTEAKQEVAVVLGSAGHNVKSGVRVYIPGKDRILIRRSIQPMAMTPSMINHMNDWANGTRPVEHEDFVFKDTMGRNVSYIDPFFAVGRQVMPPVVDPENIINDASVTLPIDQGVIHPSSNRTERQGLENFSNPSSEPTATPAVVPELEPTQSVVPTQVPTEVPTPNPVTQSFVEMTWPTTRSRRAPGIDLSNLITSDGRYATRGRRGASVNQMSLHKSLQSEHSDAAILAAKKELKQLVDLKTWVYIKSRSEASPSVHTRETPCSMFLKQKFNSRGEFLLWKARLVDGGHRTDPTKYDPFEKTSPTISLEVVMILLNMVVSDKFEIEVFDVPGAYLNASLQPGRFHMMRISKSIAKLLIEVDPRARAYLSHDGSILVEIRRSLYGLPEAAKLWNDYLTGALINGGYQVCPHDPCLYVRRRGNEISIVGIYVDDCIHIYRGANIYRELYASLRNANLNDLKIEKLEGTGSISFLGLNIAKDGPRNLIVNQSGYMASLLDTFSDNYRLNPRTPIGIDAFRFPTTGEDARTIDSTPFASKLMKVRYVERTRPDVSLALGILQTKMRSPTVLANNKLRRVVAYLESTKDLGIRISPTEMKLKCYCDAAFAVHDTRESQSGFVFTLGDFGIPILWKSIKQKLVANSSTEAELICIYDALDHILWIRRVLEWLGHEQGTTKLYQDNTSTITMAHMGRGASGSNTKHIDIRYFFIKQFIDAKVIEIDHLGTDQMIGDFFASPRQGQDFRRTRDVIMGYVD